MASDEVRPFLAAQRHDVLRDLVAGRNELIQSRVMGVVGRGMDPTGPKIDGKGGALDGTPAIVSLGGAAHIAPLCQAYPGGKTVEHPTWPQLPGTGKEAKDVKESKEGKDAKDGVEESSSSKFSSSEVQNPITRFGDSAELPWEAFNAIAEAHPGLVEGAIERGSVVF